MATHPGDATITAVWNKGVEAKGNPMRFSRWVFFAAGVYGLIVLTPQFFLEGRLGQDYPPPVTHPEFYYGFLGVALSWQLLFLVIASDPDRFRPAMLPAVLEKMSFAVTVGVLYLLQRTSAFLLGFAAVDATWGLLFTICYLRMRYEGPSPE
jgi:hypothetical protein